MPTVDWDQSPAAEGNTQYIYMYIYFPQHNKNVKHAPKFLHVSAENIKGNNMDNLAAKHSGYLPYNRYPLFSADGV